jgi:hypothetical protein
VTPRQARIRASAVTIAAHDQKVRAMHHGLLGERTTNIGMRCDRLRGASDVVASEAATNVQVGLPDLGLDQAHHCEW